MRVRSMRVRSMRVRGEDGIVRVRSVSVGM